MRLQKGTLLILLCLLGLSNAFSDHEFDAPAFYTSNRDYFDFVSSQINPLTSSVELTTSTSPLRAAALWYKTPVLTRGLHTKFSFRIDNRNGADSAHGITFLIQNDVTGSFSLGGVSAGLGYASPSPSDFSGIKNSIAIEFDCIGNPEMNDPIQSHLSVHTRNADSNSANEKLASIYSFKQLADFCSGQTTTVEVTYEPGFLTVLMSPIISPILDRFPISIEDRLSLQPGGKSFIGFTSSTGRQGAVQEIVSWSYNFLGAANAANTLCGGPSEAIAGVPSNFWIQLKDQYNNLYPFGGPKISFKLDGPGQSSSIVTDHSNGTFQASSTATLTGTYTVDARLEDQPLSCSSSFLITLLPGPLSGTKTLPLTTLPQQVTAGKMNSLKIQAYDTYGNKIETGGEEITAELSPRDERDIISIEDGGDGTYTIYFTTFKAVPFSLAVFGNAQQIKGGPFSMTTQPGAVSPSSSYAEGWISLYKAGKAETFNVVALDQYNNLLRRGGDQVEIVADPPDYVSSTIDDLGTGIYKVTLYLEKSGKYDVIVKINGAPILHSPFPLVVEPVELDISNSLAVGEDLSFGFAGVQSQFTILGRDKFNNSIGGVLQAKFSVMLIGKTSNLTASAVNTNDGTVTVTYTPTISGSFSTHITSSEIDILNSPSSTLIEPARESPSKSFIILSNSPLTAVNVIHELWLQVQIVDEFGNFLEIGGHDITANVTSLKRRPISLKLLDNQNGTYTITFFPEKDQHGPYVLEILLDQEHIKDSPFSLDIKPIDKTNTIALAVCIPIVVVSVAAIGGLLFLRKWKKGKGYQLLSTEEPPAAE